MTQQGIHFIGIGGVGMSGIASIFLKKGYKVSGSDISQSDRTLKLANEGARIFIGHKSSNIIDGIDRVVVSSAISQNNPELIEAHKRKLNIVHRSDLLSKLLKSLS